MRGRYWAIGPALQSNSYNCLVLILHRQLGSYLLGTGESYHPTAQTYTRLDISQCLILTKRRPTHCGSAQHAVQSWCQSVVVMLGEKQCLAGVEMLAQSPTSRMDTRETPATKAVEVAAPQREPRDICALATQRTFLTQEEMVLAQTGLCCLLLPIKEKSHTQSIRLHPKWFSMSQVSLQIKNKAKINIGVRLNMNLRRKMSWTICLATRHGNDAEEEGADYQYIIKLNQNNASQQQVLKE